jgi:hypothetical protein
MKPIVLTMALVTALATALGGCASAGTQLSDEAKLGLYRTHAGEPVGSFRYFGRLNGWTPLSDESLVVWTRPSEAYLLELFGSCQDLEFAPAIRISNQASTVYSGFDSVIPMGAGAIGMRNIPCRIETIRPLQVNALKDAQRELREANAVEREEGN